jgi:hypothetical protein
MANTLFKYRDERNLTNELVASELSALLGKRITPAGVHLWGTRRRPPKAWADALGIAWEDDEPDLADFIPDDTAGDGEPQERHARVKVGDPPRRPDDARSPSRPVAGGDLALVRDRIAKFYGAIGAGASMITQNDGYGKVADVYSGELADAWIAAAKANANVARVVQFMESGGPVGELVVCHVILTLGFVYVSGRGPDLDFLYQGQFGKYRATALSRAAAGEAEGFDGAGQNGASHPVADAAAAPA